MLDSNDYPAREVECRNYGRACNAPADARDGLCAGCREVEPCRCGAFHTHRFRVLSLFAGIGGLDLGLEAHCCETVAYSEVDPYASAVMEQRFPNAVNLGDITTIDWEAVAREHTFDIICGGFPCQDISTAGRGAGIDGERSGLWRCYADAIRVLRPRGVLVENVSALLARGIDRVLGDVAACGYDAEWDCIPAAAVGAPHLRDRVFLIAYRADAGEVVADADDGVRRALGRSVGGGEGASAREARSRGVRQGHRSARDDGPATGREDAPDADSERGGAGWQGRTPALDEVREPAGAAAPDAHLEFGRGERPPRRRSESDARRGAPADANELGAQVPHRRRQPAVEQPRRASGTWRPWGAPAGSDWWRVEPEVGRVADGIPRRVDRLRCLGNAVVPQVAEHVAGILIDRMEAAA